MDPSAGQRGEVIFKEVTDRWWMFQLITEVRTDGVHLRFKPFQRSFRRIAVKQIREVSVTSYSALSYAGWHWGVQRTVSGNTVYRLKGSRGVEVVLKGGEQWFIGSQRPEEFKESIEQILN